MAGAANRAIGRATAGLTRAAQRIAIAREAIAAVRPEDQEHALPPTHRSGEVQRRLAKVL